MAHILLPNQVAGVSDLDSVDPEVLQWEYDDERGRMYVMMPDDP